MTLRSQELKCTEETTLVVYCSYQILVTGAFQDVFSGPSHPPPRPLLYLG